MEMKYFVETSALSKLHNIRRQKKYILFIAAVVRPSGPTLQCQSSTNILDHHYVNITFFVNLGDNINIVLCGYV
jgi:hypothetical protein